MLKKDSSLKIQKYLREKELSSSLTFTEMSPIGFHWANDRNSSSFVKELFTDNPREEEAQRLVQLELDLISLKEIPIWLMSRRGKVKSDLFNLYQCYLDPRLKNQWFALDDILVSTTQETGPFSSIKNMRWFDANTYAKFIYLKLINSWAPQREFRLSLNIPIEVRGGNSPLGSIYGKLHQITGHGIVLNLEKLGQSIEWYDKEIMILKKGRPLNRDKLNIERCFHPLEWMDTLKNFSVCGSDFRKLIHSQIESPSCDHFFVFIPFSMMRFLSVKGHTRAMENLKGVFDEAEDTIQKYIRAA